MGDSLLFILFPAGQIEAADASLRVHNCLQKNSDLPFFSFYNA